MSSAVTPHNGWYGGGEREVLTESHDVFFCLKTRDLNPALHPSTTTSVHMYKSCGSHVIVT